MTKSKPTSVLRWLGYILLATLFLFSLYLAQRFLQDRAVDYDDIQEHFKYGSLGGERNLGIPYWLWKAVPKVCPELLPERKTSDIGLESIG